MPEINAKLIRKTKNKNAIKNADANEFKTADEKLLRALM